MAWCSHAIEKLAQGDTVTIYPRGHSMQPLVCDKDEVVLAPITEPPEKGAVVLCKVRGKYYLHLVKAVSSDGRFQIGNNRGHINGWIHSNSLFGVAVEINKGQA